MFASVAIAVSLAVLPVFADVVPLEPAPGEVYNEGSTCHVAWDADTTGQWQTMAIQLMSGPNDAMVPMSTIAIVDGTDASNTTLDYPCLSVTPNSPIYFYQFIAADAVNKTWTGRFTIADAEGNSTPAANATQPDGEAIAWGLGVLTNPSQAVPPPDFSDSSSVASSATPAPSSPASSAPPASTSGFVSTPVVPLSSSTGSSSSTSTAPPNPTTSDSANSAAVAFKARAVQTMLALLVPAILFITMF